MTEQELMLTRILNCRRVDLYTQPPSLTAEQSGQLTQMRQRREQGEPLQYILGECEFMGLRFKVDSRVLIPRPETEILVEAVIQKNKFNFPADYSTKILDIGTGSGNIAVSLAKFLPKAFVSTIDISAETIALAKENAALNGVADRIEFIHDDMKNFFKCYGESAFFDIIVSNPPYVKRADISRLPKDVQKEPLLALDGGEDGMDYLRTILEGIRRRNYLNAGGFLFLEIGDEQQELLKKLLRAQPFYSTFYFLDDYTRMPRVAVVQGY